MGYVVEGLSLVDGELPVNKIIHGDALEVLKKLPDNSIDCIITSPPYWGKRQYSIETNKIWGGDKNCKHEWVESPLPPTKLGEDGYDDPKYISAYTDKPRHGMFCRKCSAWFGQLGLEPSPEMFVEHLIEIFREVKRVLKPQGNLFVNIDDTFARSQGWKSGGGLSYKENEWERTWVKDIEVPEPPSARYDGAPRKSLCLIPELFAIKMVYELGFTLRQKIIWTKKVLVYKEMKTIGNAMPESMKDRQTHTFEYIYHFTKSPKYYYNQLRTPVKEETIGCMERSKRLIERTGLPVTPKNKYYQSLINGEIEMHGFAGVVTGRFMQSRFKYNGKFSGMGEDAEMYGSPRARTQRKKYDNMSDISFAENLAKIRDKMREEGLPEVSPLGAIAPDVVLINTEPFPEAHFATYPTNLVKFLLEIGCPKSICVNCGEPSKMVLEKEYIPTRPGRRFGSGKSGSELDPNQSLHTSGLSRYRMITIYHPNGWDGCNCSADHEPGIVLDPFLGSGTTALVALKMGYRFIGIELSMEYCQMALKRIKPYLDQRALDEFFEVEVAQEVEK